MRDHALFPAEAAMRSPAAGEEVAGIDREHDARDGGGGVRGQEGDGVGDLRRRREPAEGGRFGEPALRDGADGETALERRRAHIAGRDGVDADAAPSPGAGEGLGQGHDRRLGRPVDDQRPGLEAGHRGDSDDAAAAARGHARRRRARIGCACRRH